MSGSPIAHELPAALWRFAIKRLVVHELNFLDKLVSNPESRCDAVIVFGVKFRHIDAALHPDAANRADVTETLQFVGDQAFFWHRIKGGNQLSKECLPAFATDCACNLTAPPNQVPVFQVIIVALS